MARWLIRHRSSYDVVYATGLELAAVAAARLTGKPIMVKVPGDPVWERARRLGITRDGFDRFEATPSGTFRVTLMRAVRNWWIRNATHVTTPSESLRRAAVRWGADPAALTRIPNGVRIPEDPPRERSRDRPGARVVFVGRLIELKRLDVILEALASAPGVSLSIIGDGPEAGRVKALSAAGGLGERVSLRGAIDHDQALGAIANADALVLASEYENFPHVAIEALVCGTPVVAPAVGGITDFLSDDVNGLLFDPPTAESLGACLRRLADDRSLRPRLSEAARETGAEFRFERTADHVEELLARIGQPLPHVVMLGKSRDVESGGEDLGRRLRVLARHLRVTWISVGRAGMRTEGGACLITLPAPPGPVGTVAFHLAAALLALALSLRRHAAIVCQGPLEGAFVIALGRLLPRARRPYVVVEAHGDWTAAPRLYGGPVRRAAAPLAVRVAVWSLRRADRLRVVSDYLVERARASGYDGEVDEYMAWVDSASFLDPPVRPLPAAPQVVFAGTLNIVKGVDVLIRAWEEVVRVIPAARLTIVGGGPEEGRLREQTERLGLDGQVRFEGPRPRDRVRELLDRSRCLVMPSRSEGLPRVAFEAMARGRPVIASRVGGIPDQVSDRETGLLVPPDDHLALGEAIIELLSNPGLARRLGAASRRQAARLDPQAQYEAGTARLSGWVAGLPRVRPPGTTLPRR